MSTVIINEITEAVTITEPGPAGPAGAAGAQGPPGPGVTPSTGWTTSNVTTTKALNANLTSLDELADIVATMIEALKTQGIFTV